MLADSFYRRPLPPPLIAFSSPEGRGLFREALAAGTLEGYFPLAEQFHTQAEPAFCGLGTLVIALNALAIDPGRLWRGPWRWYSEELLDCCRPLAEVRREGLTLDDFACLARCNGATALLQRPPEISVDGFREALAAAARAPEGPYVIAAYDRGTLGQTGGGHYSPVGGYHQGRDLALLLDVARFKYPPHWVPVPLLFSALLPVDPATSRPRGYVLLGRAETAGRALCSVSCRERPFAEAFQPIRATLSAALRDEVPASPGAAVAVILRHLPAEAIDVIALSLDALGGSLTPEHRALLNGLIQALRESELSQMVERALAGPAREGPAVRGWLEARSAPVERMVLLLLILPEALLSPLPAAVREGLDRLRALEAMPPLLAGEVERLRGQVAELERLCCAASRTDKVRAEPFVTSTRDDQPAPSAPDSDA